MQPTSKILALDFDGVICNGLAEYFETSKKTYQLIWNSDKITNLEHLRHTFYQLRPVIETGWEMPLLIRALQLKITAEEIFSHWNEIVKTIITQEQISSQIIAQKLDEIRDNFIKNDLDQWIKLHQIYPGIKEKINQILSQNIKVYIISTKEGRFIKQILQQEAIKIPETNIFGKECKRPKHETLSLIIKKNQIQPENVIFIEDRIEPLEEIYRISDLNKIQLYLATWGYNTPITREKAKISGYIKLLDLNETLLDLLQN